MDINQSRKQTSASDIDLKDIFGALWRQKFIIISIVLITTILTGLYSVFIIKPIYNSNLNILIKMPETYTTKYGDYPMPFTMNQQYIDLITNSDVLNNTIKDMENAEKVTVEDLISNISISSNSSIAADAEQNSFNVRVSANSPEEAKLLAQSLYNNYVEFVEVMITQRAVNFFISDIQVKSEKFTEDMNAKKQLLSENEALLKITSQTINQDDAVNKLQKDVNHSSFVVIENLINPNYIEIEKNIINYKQEISGLENSLSLGNEYLEELNATQKNINDYYQSGNLTILEDNFINIFDSYISMPSEPLIPLSKSGPNLVKNVFIGAMFGFAIAILVAFLKEYWYKKD